MYLPIELQSQILYEAVEICPLHDLWKLRAVNFFFASEVEAFLLERVELRDGAIPSTANAEPKIRWEDLPYRMKRVYLHRKIQIHDYSQCGWSSLVHGILDLPHQRTETLINQLIDAYLCGEFSGCRKLLDPDLYTAEKNNLVSARRTMTSIHWPLEGFKTTLEYALAASAIQRGDCIQLQTLLDRGIDITGHSDRLALVPLDVAAKKGSKATIELLVARGCPMKYRSYKYRHYYFDETKVTDMMAQSGNDIGLKVWIDRLIKDGPMHPKLLKRTMVRGVLGGHVEVLKLVQEKFEALYGNPGWDAHMLDHAIRYGSLDPIKYLFRRGEVDAHTRTSPSDRMPLLKLLCGRPIQNRPDIVRFLLENGADPNGNDPPKKKTPLEVAVKAKDFESASILLKYGAAVDFKWIMPLLLNSQTSAALAQLLWPGRHSRRVYKTRGKSYTLCREAKIINNVGNVFLELGWSEQDVKGLGIDHFIDVF